MSACTCGRSPTDNCVGWHNLSEDKYLEKKAAYEARKAEKATQFCLGFSLIIIWPLSWGLFNFYVMSDHLNEKMLVS